jgi:glycosyltransferase involved in cell wall biosynthesis
MRRVGILVGENNWSFFRDIAGDLSQHFQVETYTERTYRAPLMRGRINRWALHNNIRGMLQRNDVCFFEWASDLLMTASHMPKHCKIIARLHSFELYEWAPAINWDVVDRIVFVSEAMRRLFVQARPEQQNKTIVVYNGVALDRFRPSVQHDFQFNLGMLCSIVPIKRVYETILAHYSLLQTGCPAHLHIGGQPAGDGRYAAAVYRLVEQLGIVDSVTFHGQVIDTPAWLQQIDIFLSNSYWEGQQVALLEAMACGCYCLSHAWLGVEEVLPSANIFVTEAELRDKIVAFAAQNEDEQRRNRAEMRSIACQRFDLALTKTSLRQIIDGLS